MYLNSHKLFKVHDATWYDDMCAFRARMKDLDIIIKNLMNVTFNNINNMGEAITNLYGLRMYMNRSDLMANFDSIIASVSSYFYKFYKVSCDITPFFNH